LHKLSMFLVKQAICSPFLAEIGINKIIPFTPGRIQLPSLEVRV
jgi:hypothetical protein